MSGELLIQFEDKKAMDELVALSDNPKACVLFPPKMSETPADSAARGLYVEFNKKLWGRNVVSFEHAIWDHFSSQWAKALAIEICRRYRVKRIGWDCVGWDKRPLAEYTGTPLFSFEIEGYRRLMKEPAGARAFKRYKEAIAYFTGLSRRMKREARKFFDSGEKWTLPKEEAK